jgi:hypothetical protein
MTNLGARIRSDKQRLEQVKTRQQRVATAEESPNGVTIAKYPNGYCHVTFAEKPDREILDALRDADFWWQRGSWAGKSDQLPAAVTEMAVTQSLPEGTFKESGTGVNTVLLTIDALEVQP